MIENDRNKWLGKQREVGLNRIEEEGKLGSEREEWMRMEERMNWNLEVRKGGF